MSGGGSEGENKTPADGGRDPKVKKKKVKRRMKSVSQLAVLEEAYAVESYPSEQLRADLSVKLGLTDRQLQMWFCHRRLKDRKNPPVKRSKEDTSTSAATAAASSGGGIGDDLAGASDHGASGSGSSPVGHKARASPVICAVGLNVVYEALVVAFVEEQIGEPLRDDGPILGTEFDPLPRPDAYAESSVRTDSFDSSLAASSQSPVIASYGGGQGDKTMLPPQQGRQGPPGEFDDVACKSSSGPHPITGIENPVATPSVISVMHEEDVQRTERKRKSDEASIAKEFEAHEKKIRKEVEIEKEPESTPTEPVNVSASVETQTEARDSQSVKERVTPLKKRMCVSPSSQPKCTKSPKSSQHKSTKSPIPSASPQGIDDINPESNYFSTDAKTILELESEVDELKKEIKIVKAENQEFKKEIKIVKAENRELKVRLEGQNDVVNKLIQVNANSTRLIMRHIEKFKAFEKQLGLEIDEMSKAALFSQQETDRVMKVAEDLCIPGYTKKLVEGDEAGPSMGKFVDLDLIDKEFQLPKDKESEVVREDEEKEEEEVIVADDETGIDGDDSKDDDENNQKDSQKPVVFKQPQAQNNDITDYDDISTESSSEDNGKDDDDDNQTDSQKPVVLQQPQPQCHITDYDDIPTESSSEDNGKDDDDDNQTDSQKPVVFQQPQPQYHITDYDDIPTESSSEDNGKDDDDGNQADSQKPVVFQQPQAQNNDIPDHDDLPDESSFEDNGDGRTRKREDRHDRMAMVIDYDEVKVEDASDDDELVYKNENGEELPTFNDLHKAAAKEALEREILSRNPMFTRRCPMRSYSGKCKG